MTKLERIQKIREAIQATSDDILRVQIEVAGGWVEKRDQEDEWFVATYLKQASWHNDEFSPVFDKLPEVDWSKLKLGLSSQHDTIYSAIEVTPITEAERINEPSSIHNGGNPYGDPYTLAA